MSPIILAKFNMSPIILAKFNMAPIILAKFNMSPIILAKFNMSPIPVEQSKVDMTNHERYYKINISRSVDHVGTNVLTMN